MEQNNEPLVKERFVSANSIFGVRWAKTPRAKIIWGIALFVIGIVAFLDDPNNSLLLAITLLIGGPWLVYKGITQKKPEEMAPTK